MCFFSSRNWHPSSDMPTTKSSRPCNGTPNHASSQPSSPHLLVSPYYSLSLLTGSHALPSPPTSTSLSLLFSLPLLPPPTNSTLCIFSLFSSSSSFFSFSSVFPPNTSVVFWSNNISHPFNPLLFLPSNSILFSSHQFNPLLFPPTNPTLSSLKTLSLRNNKHLAN